MFMYLRTFGYKNDEQINAQEPVSILPSLRCILFVLTLTFLINKARTDFNSKALL